MNELDTVSHKLGTVPTSVPCRPECNEGPSQELVVIACRLPPLDSSHSLRMTANL